MRATALAAMLAVCAASAPASSAEPLRLRLSERDNQRRVTVAPGTLLEISQPANPGTGYSWEIVRQPKGVLCQQGDVAYAPARSAAGQAGAGGTETFRFAACGTGEGELALAYRRPWEASADPIRRFMIRVVVQAR